MGEEGRGHQALIWVCFITAALAEVSMRFTIWDAALPVRQAACTLSIHSLVNSNSPFGKK